MMKFAAGLAAAWLATAVAGPAPAVAIGLCGCCVQQPVEACAMACAKVGDAGQCPSTVVFDGKGEAGTEGNPLIGLSLKDLALGDASSAQLESLRRFLERYRRRAVRTYLSAARKFRKGRLARAEMDKVKALYDEALVNYQHGMRAYLIRIGRKAD